VGDTPHAHPRLTSSRYTFHACSPWHTHHCCGKRSPTSRSQHRCCGAARVASLGVAKSFRNVLSLPPNGPAWRGGCVCHCCGARAGNARREGSHGVHRYSSLAALLRAGRRCTTVVAKAQASHCCGSAPLDGSPSATSSSLHCRVGARSPLSGCHRRQINLQCSRPRRRARLRALCGPWGGAKGQEDVDHRGRSEW
jgi:hypothetical protein